MYHYEFPIINHLDDMLPAIEGREDIKLMVRDDYQVIDYHYVLPDTFPAEDTELSRLRRECRGLLFNRDGSLLARRFHKFFNMGEREETLPNNISFNQDHHILAKMDGSMVSPFISQQGRLYYATMMGNTDVAQMAEDFIGQSRIDYDRFSRDMFMSGWSPIFEWCGPGNRIVLKYNTPNLILLAIRHNITGVYKRYDEVRDLAYRYNIPLVKSFGHVNDDPAVFMEQVHNEIDIEGYVVRFDDGHAMKLKTSWYILRHKIKEQIKLEKNIWELILDGDMDDVIPTLTRDDREKVERFASDFHQAIHDAADVLSSETAKLINQAGDDRAKFAHLVKSNPRLGGPLQGMAFRLYSKQGHSVDMIREYASKSTGSANKIEEARKTIKVQPWLYN